ncbi:hypothetical protein Tco_1214339 [Tanacetum coccineum]
MSPIFCYESNYSGFDHFQPPQYSVIHQPPHEKTIGELLAEERAANIDQSPPQEMSIQDMEDLKQHYLDEMKSLINDLQIKDYRNERIDSSIERDMWKLMHTPESELVSLEVVENENGEIDTDILLTIKDDILREKLLNVNLLIAKIEALKDNPTPSFDFVTKSPSTSPNSFLEETDTSFNSLPEFETFCFNLEEKSSGNPTSYTDLSLPDYEAFFCDNEPDSGDFDWFLN